MTEKIRVLIADDHFVARFGLRGLIDDQPDMMVVAEAKNGAEAVTQFRQHKPDVVAMDVRMTGFDGVQATAAIKREAPDARVLIISSYDTEADILRVHNAGAAGYIMKEAEPEELLRALRMVARGDDYLPAHIRERLQDGAEAPRLSARDVKILELMSEGRSNKEIAEAMSLTAGTVRIYASQIFDRLQVGNRAEAIARAIRKGLIRPPR